MSISSSEKMRVVPRKVVMASFFTERISPLSGGFWPDVSHQQAYGKDRILFVDAGIGGLFLAVHRERFDRCKLNPLACNIDIFAFRQDFYRIG